MAYRPVVFRQRKSFTSLKGFLFKFIALITVMVLFPLMGPVGCGERRLTSVRLEELKEPAAFSLYYPLSAEAKPSVPPYQIRPDLANVKVGEGQAIPPTARTMLANSGFALTHGGGERLQDFYMSSPGPLFITMDALAHTSQVLFRYILGELERNHLQPLLVSLTSSMIQACHSLRGAGGSRLAKAAVRNEAFFGVAGRLLGIESSLSKEAEEMANGELSLIERHSGSAVSPIFGRILNYDRFSPPGHYRESEVMEGYYKATTWYETLPFRLRLGDSLELRERGRMETRQALLLVASLHKSRVDGEPAWKIWELIYQTNRFFLGYGEGLNIYDYSRLMREVFGEWLDVSRLEDDREIDLFIDKALELPPPSFQSQPASEEGGEYYPGLRFLGPRFTPDSYIFRRLTSDEVKGRELPRGMDLPAVLGSNRAEEICLEVYHEGRYEGYQRELETLRNIFAGLGVQVTASDLFWNNIYTMKNLFATAGKGYPSFMQSSAWIDRGLYSFLGAWADSRRDISFTTVGIQTGTSSAAGRKGFPGYVEPNQGALARLASIVDMARRGLEEREMLAEEAEERLSALYDLLIVLRKIAERELLNQPFSSEEEQVIREIGERMRYICTFPRNGHSVLAEESLAGVVEIHEDRKSGLELEVGVGNPVRYHVIVPYQGSLYYAVGAGYSYYEFTLSMGETLDDESWKGKLSKGDIPSDPAWTLSFLK